jgi:hypothetical protein
MLYKLMPIVDKLWSIAEVAGAMIPKAPNSIRRELNEMITL